MRFYSKFSLYLFLAALLLIVAACRPPRPPLPPSPREVARTIHRYHYFPGARVYYHPTRRVYFYLDGGVWLSAPILPPHIHIDLDHFIHIDIDGPKPYIYHRDHLRRYPPGLRKEKNRRQREKWEEQRERQRERDEDRRDRKKEKREEYRDRERRERDHDDDRYERDRDMH